MGFKLRKPWRAQRVSTSQDTAEVRPFRLSDIRCSYSFDKQISQKRGKLARLGNYLKTRTKVFHKKTSENDEVGTSERRHSSSDVLTIHQSESRDVTQHGEVFETTHNTDIRDEFSDNATRITTPVEEEPVHTIEVEYSQLPQEPHSESVHDLTEDSTFWEVST